MIETSSTAPARARRVRSLWLRPVALVFAAGLHACALMFLTIPRPALPSPDETIDITVTPQMGTTGQAQEVTPDSVPQPETPPDPTPKPDPDPTPDPVVPPDPTPDPPPDPTPPPPTEVAETPPDPVPPPDTPPDPPPNPTPPPPVEDPAPPPDPVPQVVAEPPKREAPDAPVIPRRVEPPRPVVDRQKILKQQQQRERARQRRQAARRAAAQSAAQSRAGVADGQQQRAMSQESYKAKVYAELAGHISSPDVGVVGIFFRISPSGTVSGVNVTRSSGNAAVDSAVLRGARSIHPGPPPSADFTVSTNVRVHP